MSTESIKSMLVNTCRTRLDRNVKELVKHEEEWRLSCSSYKLFACDKCIPEQALIQSHGRTING